jgi:DNA gyrase subunit A
LAKLGEGEKIVSVLPLKEFTEGHYICSVTAKGYVKKTDLMAYSNIKASGIIALKLDDGDALVSCVITNGKNELLIATRSGRAIRFTEEEVRPTGRASRGVIGIWFDHNTDSDESVTLIDTVMEGEGDVAEGKPIVGPGEDRVVGMEVLRDSSTVLSVCENGYGKRTPLEEYRVQGRGGKGIYTIRVTERNGAVVGIMQVDNNDDLMVMTSSGKITRFNVQEVGVIGRLTQGVRLMHVEGGEKVISLCKVQKVEGEEL